MNHPVEYLLLFASRISLSTLGVFQSDIYLSLLAFRSISLAAP